MTPIAPRPWAIGVAFTLVYVAWGTTYLAIERGVSELPPALFSGTRLLFAGLVLIAWNYWRTRSFGVTPMELLKIFAVGQLLFTVSNFLLTFGEMTVHSSTAAVLVATTPLWMGLFTMCCPGGDKLSCRGWIGLCIGLVGVCVLHPLVSWGEMGPCYILCSSVAWALGTVWLKHMKLTTDHLASAAWQLTGGGLSLALIGLMMGEAYDMPAQVSWQAIGAFFYLLVVGSLIGFVAFNWLLAHVTPAKVGTYAYVNPAVAILVGWAAGEKITWLIVGGICVILFGVFLVREVKPREADNADTDVGSAMPALAASATGRETVISSDSL